MKNILLFVFLFIPVWIFGQDLIELKDKTIISARIVQEDKESVVYLIETGSDKLIKQIDQKEVKKTKYEKIPKGVNVIVVVHDSLSNEHLLTDVINHLIVSSYPIESFDNKYLTVSTEYESKERITAEIIDESVFFRCFYLHEEVSIVYPHNSAKVSWGKKPKPGEKRGIPGTLTFKHLDKVARSYLKDGNGTLEYKSEIEE